MLSFASFLLPGTANLLLPGTANRGQAFDSLILYLDNLDLSHKLSHLGRKWDGKSFLLQVIQNIILPACYYLEGTIKIAKNAAYHVITHQV